MISQNFFNYHFSTNNNKENFFVNQTNRQAFDIVIDNNFDQNIFLFAFLLLFKEFIMLFVRINSVKKFIIDYKFLNTEILLFFSTFVFSFFEYYKFSQLSAIFFIIIVFLKLPLSVLKKEFFKL